jgi:hypothetical protein
MCEDVLYCVGSWQSLRVGPYSHGYEISIDIRLGNCITFKSCSGKGLWSSSLLKLLMGFTLFVRHSFTPLVISRRCIKFRKLKRLSVATQIKANYLEINLDRLKICYYRLISLNNQRIWCGLFKLTAFQLLDCCRTLSRGSTWLDFVSFVNTKPQHLACRYV